ncbi:hypothetical protein F3157_16425 [Virgibacillus dakarensis]|nr:hypothetical protein [Virgibacillus dakarensis]
MGYVLPISQHQYHDYKNRITKDKQDPFYIENPYKIILELQNQDPPRKKSQQPIIDTFDEQEKQIKLCGADKIYANLTGKGKHFNVSI